MTHLIWIGLSILLVILILFFVMLAKLKISVIINNKDIKVLVYKVKVFDSANKPKKPEHNKTKTPKQKEEEIEKNYKGFKQGVNFIRRVFDDKNDDILYMLKHIKRTFSIKRLDISLDYGFGDAAVTGITGGVIWLLITNVTSFLAKYINIKEFLNLAVKPVYTEKVLDFNLNFCFTVRIYHLLQALRLVLRFKNTLKGGN